MFNYRWSIGDLDLNLTVELDYIWVYMYTKYGKYRGLKPITFYMGRLKSFKNVVCCLKNKGNID